MAIFSDRYQGVTTAQVLVGQSVAVKVSGGPYVTDILFTGVTGSNIFFTGVSMAAQTIAAVGALLSTQALNIPYTSGNADIYLATGSGDAVAYVAKKLSAGYSGDVVTLNGE